MCLLVTKNSLKTYNVQTMCLLVIQVSLKSIKCVCLLPKCHLRFHKANEATWMLATKVSPKAPQVRYNNIIVISVMYLPNLHMSQCTKGLSRFPIATEVTQLKQRWSFYQPYVHFHICAFPLIKCIIMMSHTLLPCDFTLVDFGNSNGC